MFWGPPPRYHAPLLFSSPTCHTVPLAQQKQQQEEEEEHTGITDDEDSGDEDAKWVAFPLLALSALALPASKPSQHHLCSPVTWGSS